MKQKIVFQLSMEFWHQPKKVNWKFEALLCSVEVLLEFFIWFDYRYEARK